MKVALVYDRVNKWGGAERLLLALHQIWPEAPLFTSVYDSERASWAKVFEVRTSFLQRIPLAKRHHEFFAPLMPLAFESFNFDEFDLVISITSEAAKGIITKPKTKHLCYCLTPTRYLWSGYKEYFKTGIQRLGAGCFVRYLRKWDRLASQRPDCYLAISLNVKKRIKKYYGRESGVVYPPVDLNKFKVKSLKLKDENGEKYYLIVSRLVPYKKVDLVVKVFNKLGWNLKIIGGGSELRKLKRMAKSNIDFLGQLTDEQLISYYQNCRAVIFAQEEDFGLVPLEAQACGKPVIAFRAGGAAETIKDRITGVFFDQQTPESLIEAVKKTDLMIKNSKLKSEDCRKQAEKFGMKEFLAKFKKIAEKNGRQ